MFSVFLTSPVLVAAVAALNGQNPLLSFDVNFGNDLKDSTEYWANKYGSQYDQPFSGPLSFSHAPYAKCLEDTEATTLFDIAILGMPFDTAVSYRPGARFGPYAIRSGARRQRDSRSYTLAWGLDPYLLGSRIIDCGDVLCLCPFDNGLAIDQMEVAYSTLVARPVANSTSVGSTVTSALANDGRAHPRIITLGGDHTIVLPILRSLNKVYGPISVIHFDAHLDTWVSYSGATTTQSRMTHGTFFSIAAEEGLVSDTCVHAGIRCKMADHGDIENDIAVGFQIITADDIDDLGIPEIIRRIRARVGSSPVYLSLDIDVIDPGLAPATGTPEAGGWTTREVKRILRGLGGLNFVGADIVEVSPSYDHAEITAIAAADLAHDFLAMMQIDGPLPVPKPKPNSQPQQQTKKPLLSRDEPIRQLKASETQETELGFSMGRPATSSSSENAAVSFTASTNAVAYEAHAKYEL